MVRNGCKGDATGDEVRAGALGYLGRATVGSGRVG